MNVAILKRTCYYKIVNEGKVCHKGVVHTTNTVGSYVYNKKLQALCEAPTSLSTLEKTIAMW